MQISQGLNFSRISEELHFGVRKFLYKVESALCFHFEREMLGVAKKVNFVGFQDPEYLGLDDGFKNYTVIPHGVDIDFEPRGYCGRELIFLANFASDANKAAFYLLVEKIMPLVWQERSDVKLSICGLNIPQKFIEWESSRIEVKGAVGSALTEVSSYKIFVNPVRAAAGMQNKVLAGLIAGVPVISFHSAVAGMKLEYPTCFSAKESPEEFASLICSVLQDYPDEECLKAVQYDVVRRWNWESLHREWSSRFLDL
jgi:hypothetical protein